MLATLLSVPRVERVVLNTDARARLVRDRRQELCGDSVSMNLILEDGVAAVLADVYLMTTSPMPCFRRRPSNGRSRRS